MKKLIALTLALLMLTMSFVACTGNSDETTEAPETTVAPDTTEEVTEAPVVLPYANAAELLQIIFEKYNAAQATDDTKLWVCGGNINNFETCNPEGPAAFVALDNEDYNQNLGIPAAEADKIASAASMFNMMNANTFNCFTVQLNDGVDADAFISTLKDNILARQWICGAPEKLVIAKAPGNCIIAVWGVVEFGGIVDPVAQSFATSVEGVEIVVEHNFAR
ncbi:MAG: hypothetical protein IIX44_07295 [Clostridia bacterium]|nr:hypothetical protein [Clostridia bacterium]